MPDSTGRDAPDAATAMARWACVVGLLLVTVQGALLPPTAPVRAAAAAQAEPPGVTAAGSRHNLFLVQHSVPSTTLMGGATVLYRFHLRLEGAMDLPVPAVGFVITGAGVTLNNIELHAYSDAAFSVAAHGTNPIARAPGVVANTSSHRLTLTPMKPTAMRAGTIGYFELRATAAKTPRSYVRTALMGLTPAANPARSIPVTIADPSPAAVISVRDYGAKGDGSADDSAAIQAALHGAAPGATVLVPPGVYLLESTLDITRSDVKLVGVGKESILRRRPRTYETMIAVPLVGPAYQRDLLPRNVVISRLTIDGNKVEPRAPEAENFLGIGVWQARNLVLSELTLLDHYHDAIGVANGYEHSRDVRIEKVHVVRAGRNGIHLGQGTGLSVSLAHVEDTPSPQWRPDGKVSGNGLNIEVEGYQDNAVVDQVTISDSIFDRINATGAGAGLIIQPAYGPVYDVVIKNNHVKNHPVGLMTIVGRGWPPQSQFAQTDPIWKVVIERNWVLYESASVVGGGISVHGTQNVLIKNNVFRDAGRWYRYGIQVDASTGVVVDGNIVWTRCTPASRDGAALRIKGSSTAVSIRNSGLDVGSDDSGCYLDWDGLATVTEADNALLSNVDHTPPTVSIGAEAGRAFSTSGPIVQIPVRARDHQSGVARIYFFIDGIPQGFSDQAAASFPFDPARYQPGYHTLEALAIDHSGLLSKRSIVTVKVL
jgi:hypothetical protein